MGKTIRRLRKERNLTQEELAERLNVTSQAISKWENAIGLPDISQIVPLANVLGVSTDILFGVDGAIGNDEAVQLVREARAFQEYGKPHTYLTAYDRLRESLKKYPDNMILLNNCMMLGLPLSLPENSYAGGRTGEIAAETARQARLIISRSKNLPEIMGAHHVLSILYASAGDYESAFSEAHSFPARTDYTLYSSLAGIHDYMVDYAREATCLCSDIDYALQALEDNAVKLGKAYFKAGQYKKAAEVYEALLKMLDALFEDGIRPPYHDFDSGDCYLLLAQAYLAIGDAGRAMSDVESSVLYYLQLLKLCKNGELPRREMASSPLVRETEVTPPFSDAFIKEKLLAKLSAEEIRPLQNEPRFRHLHDRVCALCV